MLNLIYYDLIATIKKLWGYIILIAVFSFVVRFIWSGAVGSGYANDNNLFYISGIINAVALGVLGVLGFLVSIAVIVSQAKWFDENILSPQGQLTNMLPVSSSQIILSKILTALFWSIVLVLMAIGVLSIFLVNTERFDNIMSMVAEIGANNNVNISIMQIVFSGSFFLVSFITGIITLCFLSQLVGQMFNRFRNFIIFISFIAILFITITVISWISSALGISIAELSASFDDVINFAISSAAKLAFVNIFIIIIYWLIGSYILRNHLNLL